VQFVDDARALINGGNFIASWCDWNIIIRIECIVLKFHWGMKELIELHFQYEALH
jgi:hypothetical protein